VKGRQASDEVIVTAGRIKFTDRVSSSNSILVGPGQKGMLKKNKFIQSPVADSNFISWKTGVLDFHDKPLEAAMQDIGDFYRIAVAISPDLQTEPGKNKITAHFEKQPLAEVLEEIKLITGLNIKQDKDSLYFSRK
jgi:ferric-dicitrate binding protein FerR (iron transport regulator)